MTIKPHLGLLVAALLVPRPKALGAAGLGTSGLVAASGLAFGSYSWASFLFRHDTRPDQHPRADHRGQFYFQHDADGVSRGGRRLDRYAGPGRQRGIRLAQLWRIRHLAPVELAFPAATATFLILPYAFNFDMTVVALGFGDHVVQPWGELSWTEKTILTLGFFSPQLALILPQSCPRRLIVPTALVLSLHVQCNQQLKRQTVPLARASNRPGLTYIP